MRILLLLAGLAGCAPMSPPAQAPVQETACSIDGLNDVVGKPYSAELGEATRARSNSKTMRVIRPGTAVTMDYRADRLNIDLDEQNVVKRLHCG